MSLTDAPGEARRALPRRCRILHVIDSLDLGGAQEVLVNLVRHADRTAFDLSVATMHGRGVYWERLRTLDVPVLSLSPHPRLPLYVPRVAWLCLTQRFDVVHAHLTGANLIAKPIAALCGVPVRINHDHCNDKAAGQQAWLPAADKFTNRFSTHVIAVSESTREYLLREEGIAADRASTIYNGVDLERFQPHPERRAEVRARLDLPQDAFVVAGIGRLSHQKNIALFLEAAALVLRKQPHAWFVLAGEGGEEAALREQVRRLGIGERVRFLGYVGDMPALYPALDMQLLTSRYEGLPMTVLESMATGTLIVASRLDGMQELLRDGEDGFLVPREDAAGFAQRVCEVIDSPALAARLRNAALAKVRAGYSAQTMTRAVEAIYMKHWAQHA